MESYLQHLYMFKHAFVVAKMRICDKEFIRLFGKVFALIEKCILKDKKAKDHKRMLNKMLLSMNPTESNNGQLSASYGNGLQRGICRNVLWCLMQLRTFTHKIENIHFCYPIMFNNINTFSFYLIK